MALVSQLESCGLRSEFSDKSAGTHANDWSFWSPSKTPKYGRNGATRTIPPSQTVRRVARHSWNGLA